MYQNDWTAIGNIHGDETTKVEADSQANQEQITNLNYYSSVIS